MSVVRRQVGGSEATVISLSVARCIELQQEGLRMNETRGINRAEVK